MQLDDDDFETREEASAELEQELGPKAAPELREPDKAASAEVRKRLSELLERGEATDDAGGTASSAAVEVPGRHRHPRRAGSVADPRAAQATPR